LAPVQEEPLRVLFVAQEISYEPQGIMSMSAVLKQSGHDVGLTVADIEDPAEYARDYQPDIVAYSVMTGSQRAYFDMNLKIREAVDPLRAAKGEKPVFSAFGGPHPTFFPEMVTEPGVDGICVGEGEGAMLDLADALAVRNGTYKTDIPNWWFNVDGEVIKNLPRPLIRELSDLPHPDRALIYDKIPHLGESKIKHFISSRGCPYACTYCFNHAYYQIYKREKRGQQRSVDDTIAEVKAVRERWPLEQAIFIDDLFVIYNDWLEEFAEKWPKEVGLPFFANVRANLLVKDPYKVELLKRAGCGTVSMGIEAANDRVRVELLKRRMTKAEIIEAGKLVRAAGIHITATNILGLPTTTVEDDFDTMRLNAQAEMSYAYAFLFQPYPGTELGQFTEEHELMDGTFEDIGEVAWDHSILVFESEEDKRAREHLQRLFALGVEFPWLEALIRRLIRLPHSKVVDTAFWWIYKLHKGYAMHHRVHPTNASPLELFKAALHFMKIKS
jgi:anaerobic magnesium-protoporphyrin IX monomethyl ester cyclase